MRAAYQRPGLPSPSGISAVPLGIVFPGSPGDLRGGEGRPAPQTTARACPPPHLHFKGKLLPDFPGGSDGGTYRLCTGRGNAPIAAPRPPRLPAPSSPRRRRSAPRAPRRRGATAAAAAAAAVGQGPRAQSLGAWLRGVGRDLRELRARKAGLGRGMVHWVEATATQARRSRAAAQHGSARSEQSLEPRSASGHLGSRRSELLARRSRLLRLRLWRWLEQWPLLPSPPGMHHTALARGPGQPITPAPEAKPLLLPAPPQLQRKGSEVKMLKARILGSRRYRRA